MTITTNFKIIHAVDEAPTVPKAGKWYKAQVHKLGMDARGIIVYWRVVTPRQRKGRGNVKDTK